jgi:O-antigen/teichoic acid export membrane protein
MDFRTLALFGLAVSAVNLLAAAIAAFLLHSVWALVIGALAGSVAALLLSYLVHPFRPRWRFSRERARELWGFGKFLTASSIVNYALTQGDDAYVGKFLGTESLGFYQLAYRLSNLPATSISQVLSQVTLPAYSAMQHDLGRLRATYLRMLKLTALVAFPIAAGLLVLAPVIVGVLYGAKWMPMVPAFQILCLFGLERAIGATSSPIFLALGKPDIGLRVLTVKLIAMALCIVPLTAGYGIAGTSVAVTLSAIVVQSALVPVVGKSLQIPWGHVVRPLLKPLVGSLLMMLVLLSVQGLVSWKIGLWQMLTLILIGSLLYAGFIAVAERELFRELKAFLASWRSHAQVLEET